MKKTAVCAIVFLFSVNVFSAFPGGVPESAGTGKDKGVFQKAADNIGTWDDISAEARSKSLRDDRAELDRRRGIGAKRNIIGV